MIDRSIHKSRHAIIVLLGIALIPLTGFGFNAAEFGSCHVETTAPEPVVQALDAFLMATAPAGKEEDSLFGRAPGAVLSVRTPEWQYTKALGRADPDTGTSMDCRMPFQIGSNTKMMTATVLLQLHEENLLSVDDLLSRHLPEAATKLPYGQSMTLRQLAQHSSGVFSYTDNAPDGTPGLMEAGTTDPKALSIGYKPEDLVQFVIDHGTPNFEPGVEGKWSYSNTGFVLIGMIIERTEKKPLGKIFETRIFGPLGMEDTFLWNDVPRRDFSLVKSYLAAPFTYETSDWNMSQGWAAGGVISTVEDMHVFINALLTGKLFRSPETLAMMQETVSTDNIAMPYYGLGLAEKAPGLWGHGGQTLGYLSNVAGSAERGLSIVGWANSSQNLMGFGVAAVENALKKSEQRR